MGFLQHIFGKKEQKIVSYEDFWLWFKKEEATFHTTIKKGKNMEKDFFEKLELQLNNIKPGIYFLAGMQDDQTVELIFTPDGELSNIIFVEELVAAAPTLHNWKFTALKPANDLDNFGIRMEDYTFSRDNLSFYPNEHPQYPDEIDITVAYADYNEADQKLIHNGIYLFLDNYLGELHAITTIDNLNIVATDKAEKELIPMHKLKDYLIWREKEFIEKYSEVGYDSTHDRYHSLEATTSSNLPFFAIVNATVLDWDGKASHPWILQVSINYDGQHTNGLPEQKTYALLDAIEEDLMKDLKDVDGYLNIGRQTADNQRKIFFACRDFRTPSKVIHALQAKFQQQIDLSYEIYKDKYWQSFERFRVNN